MPGNRHLLFAMTLTELAFVIVFVLLLGAAGHTGVLGDRIQIAQEKLKQVEDEKKQVEDENGGYRVVKQMLQNSNAFSTGGADDNFNKLLQAQLGQLGREKTLEEQTAALKSRLVDQETRMTEKARQLREVREEFDHLKRMKVGQLLREKNNIERAYQQLLEEKKSVETGYEQALKDKDNLTARVKWKGLRGGLGDPPCWFDERGRPQYIYRITFSDSSFSVESVWPPGRSAEVVAISGARQAVSESLSDEEFITKMEPVYEWAKEQKCSLWVEMVDVSTTKDRSNSGRLTVERYFYKNEVRSTQ